MSEHLFFSLKDGIVDRTGMECGYNEDPRNMKKLNHYSLESLCVEKHYMKGKLLR